MVCTAIVVSLTMGGCLPRGEPPAGRQILADATAALLGLVPANGDGVLRVLFFRPGKTTELVNLWVVSVGPNGGPSSEQMLFTDIDIGLELSYRPSAGSGNFATDARNRLYIDGSRIDPVTGEVKSVGSPSGMSQDRQRVLVYNNTGGSVLYEADDSTTVIDGQWPSFVGNTLFYVTDVGDLMRFAPGGAPERVATGVNLFNSITDQRLLLMRARPDPSMPDAPLPPAGPGFFIQFVSATVLDLTTLVETALPDGPQYQSLIKISPDGRWIAANSLDDQSVQSGQFLYHNVIVDTVTGAVEMLGDGYELGAWRPGHLEIWSSSYDSTQPGFSSAAVLIKKPGQPIVTVPGMLFDGFNDDGTYWFSPQTSPYSDQPTSDLVGIADDPTGPRFPAVPQDTWLDGVWTISDGRLLIEAGPAGNDTFEDFFFQIVDPRNGATDLFGERGILSAVGTTRAVGIFQISFERGDLTTYDFASGRSTVLASEFAMAAVTEPQGQDPYPPGGRIAYQYRSRFASPWDGLWLATVP